jgi:tetratricopeptide (TPR) repeat protein
LLRALGGLLLAMLLSASDSLAVEVWTRDPTVPDVMRIVISRTKSPSPAHEESSKDVSAASKAPAAKVEAKTYVLGVATFGTSQEAKDLAIRLRPRGFSPCTVRLAPPKGESPFAEGGWLVFIEEFPSAEEAMARSKVVASEEAFAVNVHEFDKLALDQSRDCSLAPRTESALVENFYKGVKPRAPYDPPVDATPPAPIWEQPPDEGETPFALNDRERRMMSARILARNGYYPQARKAFDKLREDYPGDDEVRDHYVEMLINNEDYALAEKELADWLGKEPKNVRALRLKALMYVRVEQYENSYPWFDALLSVKPGETGTMADYGYARNDGGDWAKALELFSEVLDNDPENEAIRDAYMEILRERRPRYNFDFSMRLQKADAMTLTFANKGSAWLDDKTKLELSYDAMRFIRPDGEDVSSIDQSLHDWRMRLTRQVFDKWAVELGFGYHTGAVNGFSEEAGLRWDLHKNGFLRARFGRNQPWTDTIEAPGLQGRYNSGELVYEGVFDDRWILGGRYEIDEYALKGHDSYGVRNLFMAALSRRLAWDPDLFLTYTFTRAFFNYKQTERNMVADPNSPPGGPVTYIPESDAAYRPISMLENEELHQISATLTRWFCPSLGFTVTGGVGYDRFRRTPVYTFTPKFTIRVGQRFEWTLGGEYISETATSTGGESYTATTGVQYIF